MLYSLYLAEISPFATLGPKELFVGRTPQDVMKELYTLDLKSIIVANWEVFAPLFDNHKARFEIIWIP
jgi:hypothetical protein